MRCGLLLVLLFLVIPPHTFAKDYMVDFFEEHYKEKMIVGGGEVKISHSWQVKTEFGNKVLVLIGDDTVYRKWLRRYLKKYNLFVVKIPDEGDDKFKYDIAVLVDVQQVHPVNNDRWECVKCRDGPPPSKTGSPYRSAASVPVAPELGVE